MDNDRIGDVKEKFLVARMTERQKKIAQFKAFKTAQTIDDLVITAVDQLDVATYLDNHKCPKCDTPKKKVEEPYIYHHKNQDVKVINYYETTCKCVKDKNDFYAENYLEDLIAFEVLQLEKEGKEVPEEIDLAALLKMK